MKRRAISWILDFTSKLPNDAEKIKCLQANDHPAILVILKYCFDPSVEWLLPEGDPPYVPNTLDTNENALYSEVKKLYLFVRGGNDNLVPLKRETLFINMLQNVMPDDAKLLLAIKNKTLPYDGIDAKLVKEAFPTLW